MFMISFWFKWFFIPKEENLLKVRSLPVSCKVFYSCVIISAQRGVCDHNYEILSGEFYVATLNCHL